jgi:AcrR family transcriptional regulator
MAATRTKGDKRERTRARLIDAAAEVIDEKGYHRATLDEIASRAGMTRGAIYGNFKDRESLFLAVVATKWRLIDPAFRPGASLKEQLRELAAEVLEAAPARQAQMVRALEFHAYALSDRRMRSRMASKAAEAYEEQAERLLQAVGPDELPMPAEQFVVVLASLVQGLLLTRSLMPKLMPDEAIIAAIETLARDTR